MVSIFIVFIIIGSFSALIAFFWVRGIDYMQENHPDYKGEDFLDWGKEEAPWESEKDWEDNNAHTEGAI
jgi:hypothetical protein